MMRRVTSRGLAGSIVVTLAVSCGTSKSSPPPPSGSGDRWAVTDAGPLVRTDFLALATASKAPALVGPFARVRLSPELTIHDAQGMAPVLFGDVNHNLDWFEYRHDAYPGAEFRVERVGQLDFEPDDWFVGRLRVVLPASGVRDRLTAAWGPPRVDGDDAYWFDPVAGLRAKLSSRALGDVAPAGSLYLDYQGYVPLDRFLGDEHDRFAFEGASPLVGASLASVRARFGHRVFDDGTQLHLWPTEVGGPTIVDFGGLEASDPITGFTIDLPAADARPILARTFGAPKSDDDGNLVYRKKPRVALEGNTLAVGAPPE